MAHLLQDEDKEVKPKKNEKKAAETGIISMKAYRCTYVLHIVTSMINGY